VVGLTVVLLPRLFTNSVEVVAMMQSLLPFMCVALLVHTASMATEGMLLAGASHSQLMPSAVVHCWCLHWLCSLVETHKLRNVMVHGERVSCGWNKRAV
jgi:Na+-driven multidrug efflux pump